MDENLMKTATVKVQKKSGFDKSHMNLFTTKVGTLTPILCDEVIPNTTTDLKVNLTAALPPLASDTFMRCDLKAEAFFVPTRILVGGYEQWFSNEGVYTSLGSVATTKASVTLPVIQFTGSTQYGSGTLADYLGVKSTSGQDFKCSMLPFLAYHRIYNDWYRNPLVQKDIYRQVSYVNAGLTTILQSYYVQNSPWVTLTDESSVSNVFPASGTSLTYHDGISVWSLRQRNFGADYFTTATPSPQNGAAQTLSFDTSGTTGNFTIAALRAANSMQQFLERNNLAGNRMVDIVKAQYGANLPSGVAQRAVLLGSASFPVYSKGVYQTNEATQATGNVPNNPFLSTGAEYGSAKCNGSDFIIKGFTAAEPGYIMVLVSLVPKVTYSSGVRRYLSHYMANGSQTDMANPILQNVGNQPIYSYELDNVVPADMSASGNPVFGYTERYAEFKTMEDELHGLLRDGESLDAFALQRSFQTAPQLGSQFLAIPTDYLDNVAAVQGEISQYGCWIDSYLDYKQSMPLARYAVPSLQDPAAEHGEDVVIPRGGTQIRG